MRVVPHVVLRVISSARIDGDSSDHIEGDSSDHIEGDSIDRIEGDSSYCTRDDRDSAVQPTKRDCTEGGSSDYTLDELGTLFFQGRLVVPNYNNMNSLEGN